MMYRRLLCALAGVWFLSIVSVSHAINFDSNYQVLSGDYNGDGLQDIYLKPESRKALIGTQVRFVINATKPAIILQQSSDGSYSVNNSPTQASLDQVSWTSSTHNLIFGYYDDDGYGDIILQSKTSNYESMSLYGSGLRTTSIQQYLNGSTMGALFSADYATITIADVDNDGSDDVVIEHDGVIVSIGYGGGNQFAAEPQDPPGNDSSVVGTLKGSFTVSEGGAASYVIPIELPPGVNGVQPSLSFDYYSQGGNGNMGVGWNFTGVSVINRCPATIEIDGFTKAVDYGPDDKFCLDGQRLILTSGTYGSNGSEYLVQAGVIASIWA